MATRGVTNSLASTRLAEFRQATGELDAGSAGQALADLRALDLQRRSHEPLLDRVWALRDNLSACNAAYVALAEALDTPLLTCDGRLARAPGMARRVELLG